MTFLLNPFIYGGGGGGGYTLAAGTGALALTGGGATLKRGLRMIAAPGALSLTGGAATLTYVSGYWMTAGTGALVLAGGAATLSYISPRRYWRINVTAFNGGTVLTIHEITMAESIGGSNVATGGTASASSTFGGAVASRAFDGNSSTEWSSSSSSMPQWIAYDLGAGVKKHVVSVSITCPGSGFTNRAPKDFDIQYSDDGSSWTTYWSVTNQTGWTASQTRTFNK